MNRYNDKLESLLLTHDYAALTPSDQKMIVVAGLTPEEYAAARTLRLRTRAVLVTDAAPADPGGLAAVMDRAQRRKGAVVPVWQMAAAVVIAVLLTWWGRGWADGPQEVIDERLAVTDTIYKEVKTVDTVFMPAPEPEKIIVVERVEVPVKERARRPDPMGKPPKKVVAAMASLPAPGMAEKSGGVKPQLDFSLLGREVYSDRFMGGY